MTIPEHMLSLPAAASALPRRAAVLLKMLENIDHGRLDVRLPDGGHCCFGDDQAGPQAEAQLAKYRRILRRLGALPGQRILEIGCGWGGFAEVAAREAGVEVVGVTLSPAQLDYAQARMRRAGLDGQVRLLLCDYRDL